MPFDSNQLDPGDIGTRYHLATLAVAQALRVPFQQAEQVMRDPRRKPFAEQMLELARIGAFNYLAAPAQTQAQTSPVGGAPDPTMRNSLTARNQADVAKSQAERRKLEMEIKKLEQDILLAKTADERAQATTELAQKQHEFAVRSQQENVADRQRQLYSTVAQNLLSTATQLRGPRDYPQFVAATSGGRGLIDQLFGSQPRPAFSAPAGPIEPQTMAGLLSQLGLGGGLTGQVAKDLGYGG